MMMRMTRSLLLLFTACAAFGQIRGGMKPVADPDRPRPVRNDVAQSGEEIVTLRHFKIRKGTFDQFLKASQEGVWPYFEKIGARVIGMWKVVDPEPMDYDEVYLSTRYASREHWAATRDATLLGGNGPDWDRCRKALDLRESLTIESSVVFLKGALAGGGPLYMPGLPERYEKQ